ncbi:hypothetical protein F0562_019026 [Nyssa sinensis]|uniref:VASt domain-containing protein n=1 Tax=Nyssa sinensis TaxID=561372 RepID=A0A5J4ZEZ5_9ASTE|nr:hypothetical protein F0562_019026 [Nyssa sinensis]
MAVAFTSAEKIEPSQPMDSSPSRRVSDAASESSSGGLSSTVDPSDRGTPDQPNSSPSPSRDLDILPQPSLRSEEYRQLFRLPHEEVLIQDFNCALQENFLLQGHMYLFVCYVCFYSNLFGFETKKIIPFHEVTSVRRAKAAAIFPTAIEIIAGGKKYFFTSFLSRDEAFKLINDGWLQHGNGAKAIADQQVQHGNEAKALTDQQVQHGNEATALTDQQSVLMILPQESKSESESQENGIVVTERAKTSTHPVDELDPSERNPISEDSKLPPNGEAEIVITPSSEVPDNLEEDSEVVLNAASSSSGKTLAWEQMNSDASKVPEYYTKVTESKFPIKVEDFFSFFFSDVAVDFLESFHKRCGDKDFKCTSWRPHEEFGHVRDVSFQHPIKLYLGAKFGGCQEVQKFRVYRNSHLVIETSQEISDVPYGDYFCVEGLWDVERDGDESEECCILRVYVNVAFSKKTMWKGKIVQSTVEECRDAYAIWINIANELLKQKNLEKEEAGDPAAALIPNGQVLENQAETGDTSERSNEENDSSMSPIFRDSKDVNQQVRNPLQGDLSGATSVASFFRESMAKFSMSLKAQSYVPLLLMITFALVLVLMQLSIVVLLARPQQIQVIPQTDCTNGMRALGERGIETMAWLEKRIHHLKDEMLTVENLLEKMRHEHALLKAQLKDLEHFRKHK